MAAPPEPEPGVLDEELLSGEVDELPPAEPEAEPLAEPEGELELDDGEVGEVELELEEGDVAPEPELFCPPESLPQPASASATAAANSSEVLVMVSPLKK